MMKMAEQPVIMQNKQLKVIINPAENGRNVKQSVVENAPKVSDPKQTVSQRLSKYAFGEEVAQPGKYVWDSYLAPTGKRVANDIVEYFLQMIKHTFQRWIWNGKILDDGKWGDRTSYSKMYQKDQPVQAMVKLSPVKELTFSSRAEANSVLEQLKATIQEEGNVTVRQYYELSGTPQLCESGVSSTSGWTNLSKVEIKEQPDGDGFYLTLPRPINLSQ
jgi:hypothetical protein